MNKKKLIISIIAAVLLVAVIVTALCIYFAPGDFHRARWGMSVNQVKSRERAELLHEEYATLSYPLDSLEGIPLDTTMFYKFDSSADRLTHVSIGINSVGFDDKKVSRIVSKLEEKYGEPAETSEVSEISYTYIWETDRTRISLKQLESYTLIVYSDITIPVEE